MSVVILPRCYAKPLCLENASLHPGVSMGACQTSLTKCAGKPAVQLYSSRERGLGIGG